MISGLFEHTGTPLPAATASLAKPWLAAPSTHPRQAHVCFVAPNIWPAFAPESSHQPVGGAELQQSILARGLARDGYRVSIICNNHGQPRQLNRDGIRFISTHRAEDGLPGLRLFHPRLTAVWRAMGEVDADIYYQRAPATLTAVVAQFCRRHGKRSIYAGASDLDFIPGRQLIRFRRQRWLFERGLAAVDAVVAQTAVQNTLCHMNYGRDATIIPNCYALPRNSNDRLRRPYGEYVLWVSTIQRARRPEIVLELARRLPHRRFVMIGGPASASAADRGYYEEIRNTARSLPNLDFRGALPYSETDGHFDRAHLVLNTSAVHCEGMPNVFLQAWARSIPTVAYFDAGAWRHGAPVYPVIDNMEGATNAIEELFEYPLRRARIGRECNAYFLDHHTPQIVLTQFEDLLRHLLAGRQP